MPSTTPTTPRKMLARPGKLGWTVIVLAVAWIGWRLLPGETPVYGYEVVAAYSHDPRAYTQGLLYSDGVLYESTGRNGRSTVRRVELATGKVLQEVALPFRFFGEGLCLHGDELFQLTWHAGVARVYDKQSFERKDDRSYEGEGWGLTTDGTHLIMSDGTDELRFLDPATFEVQRRLAVRDGSKVISQLNELEYIDGVIYANVWRSNFIARIDPKSGRVRSWIDLTGIYDHSRIPDVDAVLNGIAHDAQRDRLFVTGKLWPVLFEIRIGPKRKRR